MTQGFPNTTSLDEVLELVPKSSCVHWVSEGSWNMHDLLIALLTITGPADVYLSSYGFSEYPAQLIAEHKERGIIKKLYCLIDKRINGKNPVDLGIILGVATKIKLVNTHAMVTVIENKKHMLAVIGSANYTNNNRYEAGVIITDGGAAAFHKNWMKNEIDKK